MKTILIIVDTVFIGPHVFRQFVTNYPKHYIYNPDGLAYPGNLEKLGARPSAILEEGLSKTTGWFLENNQWIENVTSGENKKYFSKQYMK